MGCRDGDRRARGAGDGPPKTNMEPQKCAEKKNSPLTAGLHPGSVLVSRRVLVGL